MRITLILLLGSIALLGVSVAYHASIVPTEVKAQQILQTNFTKEEDNRTLQEHVWDLLRDEGGLSLDEAVTAMEIIKLESRWDTYAIGVNRDGSKDLGLWQINEKYHDISRECAFDAYCSTRYALQIYKDWGGWHAWVTYNNYLK